VADVSKGDVFVAGGQAKEFKVESIDKQDVAHLKEVNVSQPPENQPEEIQVPVSTLIDSEDWKGIEES
jgi:hypothetical protein